MEQLRFLLTTTNEWLRFAEAKNGALVAFVGIILPALSARWGEDGLANYYISFLIICSSLSLLLSLISFIPRLSRFGNRSYVSEDRRAESNLAFFGDIARLEGSAFQREMAERLGVDSFNQIDIDLIAQIHINSILTSRKMRLFYWAAWLLVAGIFTPAAIVVLLIMLKNDDL